MPSPHFFWGSAKQKAAKSFRDTLEGNANLLIDFGKDPETGFSTCPRVCRPLQGKSEQRREEEVHGRPVTSAVQGLRAITEIFT